MSLILAEWMPRFALLCQSCRTLFKVMILGNAVSRGILNPPPKKKSLPYSSKRNKNAYKQIFDVFFTVFI